MLYLHIPYCHHKCTYCGFYSVARRQQLDTYVDALCAELALRSSDKPLKTIYFGGGTPSLLSIGQLQHIVATISTHYNISQLEEVTLEANPENMTDSYLAALKSLNFVNRLSIGIQSFSDKELKLLNRVHDGEQAEEAVRRAAAAGFSNISVDLIMGLPGQQLADWQHNLDRLASLLPLDAVQHLSCYELTVESGTMLERQLQSGRLTPCDEEVVAAQYETLMQWCEAHGFEHYEVSNFCRHGHHSRHNSRYWNRTPYIGVGASAHSFDGTKRRWNVSDVDAYIAGTLRGETPFEEETLTADDAYNEYVMTALRTAEGIDKTMISSERRSHLSEKIAPHVAHGLVVESATHYRPTAKGMLMADGIAASLFV